MFDEFAPHFAMSLVSSTDSLEPTVVSPTTGIDCAQQDGLEEFFQAGQPPDVQMVVSPLIVCDDVTSSNDDHFVEDCSDPGENLSVTTIDVTFRVGDRFASFVELEKAVAAYSSRNSVQLWKRDARTIDAARKRVGNIASKMGEHLKYQSLKYCCIHGGKKFNSTATGRSSSTFKHDCGFHIYVVATKDGANLEVRSVCLRHTNHAVSSEPLSKHTPQRWKVGPGFKRTPAAHNIPSTDMPLSDETKKPDLLLIDNENIDLHLSSHQKHHYNPELYDGASDGLTGSETLSNDNVKARAAVSVRLAPVLSDNAKSEPILSSHQKHHQKTEPLPIGNGEGEPILSSHEKHEKAAAVAGKIARILSEASMPKFRRRLEVLEALLKDWSCDDDVSIVLKQEVAAGDGEKDNQCIASLCFKPAEVLEAPNKSNADTFTLPAGEADAHLSGITTVVPVVSGQNIQPITVLAIKASEPLTCFNADEANIPSSDTVKEIEVAPCMSNCGHLKESSLTVVPTKRKRVPDCGPFRSRTSQEKKFTVLTWLVGEAAAADALNGKVLEKKDVKTKPELLHCGVLDDSVDVNIVRTFFTSDAWTAATSVVKAKRSVHRWECEECRGDLKEFDSILCDWCLSWYHIPCTTLKRQPKKKLWQCSYCM